MELVTKKTARLCIAGNLLGLNRGYITTQGQIVADRLTSEGIDVITVSSRVNSIARLADVLVTILRKHKKIDILIVEIYSGRAFILADMASLLAKLLNIPTIFVLHGGNLPEFGESYPGWIRRVLGRAKVLVAPSVFLAGKMSIHGIELRVIPNVIALDSYRYRLRGKVSPKLLWMRSFHDIYNPQMAIKAFEAVRESYPEATLVMAGVDKGLEAEIKDMVAEKGLQDAVRFPGFLDHNAKIREFSNADIFLNTNRIDNMPVSVLEAFAMGLPVVATSVGGIPDLIQNGENGLLVPDGDVDGMVRAVDSLLKNSDLAELLSVNGRKVAERSSWKDVRNQWDELFREILGREESGRVSLPAGNVTDP